MPVGASLQQHCSTREFPTALSCVMSCKAPVLSIPKHTCRVQPTAICQPPAPQGNKASRTSLQRTSILTTRHLERRSPPKLQAAYPSRSLFHLTAQPTARFSNPPQERPTRLAELHRSSPPSERRTLPIRRPRRPSAIHPAPRRPHRVLSATTHYEHQVHQSAIRRRRIRIPHHHHGLLHLRATRQRCRVFNVEDENHCPRESGDCSQHAVPRAECCDCAVGDDVEFPRLPGSEWDVG
jgi:hypothetical protein